MKTGITKHVLYLVKLQILALYALKIVRLASDLQIHIVFHALESLFHICLPVINVWKLAANQVNTPYFKLVNSIMIV